MPYKIAIASGKGGTGKTSISVNLFHSFNQIYPTTLVDCDVEEPNDLIFFPSSKKKGSTDIQLKVAQIDNEKCTYCRKCVDWCEFNAITVIPPVSYTKIDTQLCHACGACLHACPHEAIFEVDHQIGEVHQYQLSPNGFLEEGNLKIGSPMQTSLIKALKKNLNSDAEVVLFDAPPGTSCPVVETISDTDYIVLVTEPTPFGLHDLKLMIDLLKEVKIPFGVVVNKAGLGFQDTYQYLIENHIELLAEIPFSKDYASLYSTGDILNNRPEEFENIYQQLSHKITQKLKEHEGAYHT
jgi:MinD superfamily P-loop ATPase